ncbi:cell wall arabinan synthesis protein [Segniliparus rotundus DSM 44985]|uniref:Cell wall arabinan synthesis protein n=1 Tax=Segniliparus rotundus (strain ATCC BAA-972 / CDC 1076 / CIP 108378 / DSM 44985 / JCM 13578) TaxID=640132 RepID=D6ZD22_SEGRD|nr:arabinosyltransferase domain-containing protein [Segniliparus rotundus]ADG99209.1 cell wall arabinan synthesis protein [Segniliparus rotundus DSM 44985]
MTNSWSGRVPHGWQPPAWLPTWRLVAVVAGLIAFVCAVLSPILPLNQKTVTIDWPQNGTLGSVTAPLDSFVAESMRAEVPCSLAKSLPEEGGNLLSTAPARGKDNRVNALFITADKDFITAAVRAQPLKVVPRAEQDNPNCRIEVHADSQRTVVQVLGTDDPHPAHEVPDPLLRPQVVGVFTDLDLAKAGGRLPEHYGAHIVVDTRFNTVATPARFWTAILGFAATALALVALARFDGLDRRRHRRFLPPGWWKVGLVDVVAVGVLALWLVIGSNTSDDGYQLTWEVVAPDAGYMVSYHRWFGVAENPVTWYYQVCSWLAQISTAAPVLRLPQLLVALACWFTISKEVIPRLGRLARRTPAAPWAAAGVFLALWLAYANGLRPEPVVALGALLTWCSIERTIATGRLLPTAAAAIIASFCLGAAPGGLIAAAALLVGVRQSLRRFSSRAKLVSGSSKASVLGWLAVLAPILASGTLVVPVVFWNQGLAGIVEGNFHVKTTIGPNRAWYEELLRYYYLFLPTADGSLARRFGVLIAFLCLVTTALILLRHKHLAGLSRGPAVRLVGIFIGTIFCMTFTPTKWTHHFGIYAGIAGAIAAFTAAAIGPKVIARRQARTYFAAAALFMLAIALTGWNMWWYVSSWGVPWWNLPPVVHGYKLADIVLVLAVAVAAFAFWQQLFGRADERSPRPANQRPGGAKTLWVWSLPAVSFAMVAFILLSFLKGAWTQRNSFSWAKSNIHYLTTGDGCALANDVLVEEDPNQGVLAPLGGEDPASALKGKEPSAFAADKLWRKLSTTYTDYTDINADQPEPTAQPVQQGQKLLPFGLDPQRVPVLGSYGNTQPSSVTTSWYELPAPSAQRPIIAVAAAGQMSALGTGGVSVGSPTGQVVLEYGRIGADGAVEALGQSKLYDIGALNPFGNGPGFAWRNLRLPRAALPAEANVVRLQVADQSAAADQWVAFTPPRAPVLRTLNEVVGEAPSLIDWQVFFEFPCQHPIRVRNGMFEIPKWRITPDRNGNAMNSERWASGRYGGPLGVTQRLLSPTTVPTYLKGRPDLDWGSLQRYTPYAPEAVPAQLEISVAEHSGLYTPGPMYTMYGKDEDD